MKGTSDRGLADGLPRQIVELVESSLDDDKAEDIVIIDLDGKTTIADYMIVASGRSSRQVGSMADHLSERLKKAGLGPAAAGQPLALLASRRSRSARDS